MRQHVSAVDDSLLEQMTSALLEISSTFLVQQNELTEVKERLNKESLRVASISVGAIRPTATRTAAYTWLGLGLGLGSPHPHPHPHTLTLTLIGPGATHAGSAEASGRRARGDPELREPRDRAAARHAARRQVVHRTTTALVHAALGLVVDGLE